mgnify:CR=1 FL=1|jgi:hypothetical protein
MSQEVSGGSLVFVRTIGKNDAPERQSDRSIEDTLLALEFERAAGAALSSGKPLTPTEAFVLSAAKAILANSSSITYATMVRRIGLRLVRAAQGLSFTEQ